MGSGAVIVGADRNDLHFTSVRLGERPAVVGGYTRKGASQGELRSHGFFYKPEGPDSGLLGLPISGSGRPGYRHLIDGSALVLFLRNDMLRLKEIGDLDSQAKGSTPPIDGGTTAAKGPAEWSRYGLISFHRCPIATLITAKRVANRAGHPGRRPNCALESNGLSQSACQLKAEHNLIPYHCSRDRGFGDWPGVGGGTAMFLVFLLFLVAVHSQPFPQNGLPTVPVILVADSIVPLNATVY